MARPPTNALSARLAASPGVTNSHVPRDAGRGGGGLRRALPDGLSRRVETVVACSDELAVPEIPDQVNACGSGLLFHADHGMFMEGFK